MAGRANVDADKETTQATPRINHQNLSSGTLPLNQHKD
jgi:hypothetical protein